MRVLVVLVLGVAALTSARLTTDLDDNLLGSLDVKKRQILILKLLNHITEPCMYKEILDIGNNYRIEENVDLYTKVDVVKTFVRQVKLGLLPRGEIFTLHIDRQLKEVVSMFHVLFYAKDFATFIKTACWMRIHCNEGMFVYALQVACRHREDCKGIILPPPYEIYPFFFVRGDVIQRSYLLKMRRGLLDEKLCDLYGIKKTDKNVYIIDENIFDRRVNLNIEDRLRYFTEDIDLNTYYYYFHVDYPFWMKDDLINTKLRTRRFELTLYVYQQILARYYLERLSNGLGDIKVLSLDKPITKGYWPWLLLHNGVQMPMRTNNYVVLRDDNVNLLRLVETYEELIKQAIVKGFITINGIRLELTKPEDIEVLGRLIYSKVEKTTDLTTLQVEAYRYLLVVLKAVLGLDTLSTDKYFVVPTVLDIYQTALRDPVFYQLQKRLILFVQLFKLRLPSYTKEELYFPGVKVDNVVVDKLVTYFDDYLMDMTNAVTLNEDEIKKTTSDMKILVRKRRLNHNPFKITLDVVSDKTVDAVVRIFLGPKEDDLGRLIDLNNNRLNFVELDSFLFKLVTGKNTIVRNSREMHNLVQDRLMTRDLWKRIDSITDVKDILIKELRNYHTGFPSRLLLPRGRVGGMRMVLYVCVTPLRLVDNVDLNILDVNRKDLMVDFRSTVLLDKMPLGFPLDRHIDETRFFTPNMKFVDIMIFHKKQMCDMRTRWERYVLRNYNMLDRNIMVDMNQDVYGDNLLNVDHVFVDTDLNTKINRNLNLDV
ncbi:basic juvenile hormone-suppressible protein 2 [Plodia interpunctella]|uniref:basic juvenile hormone-suppressible protein 2 n=1 Tax=Plodia interpunctella TaxID=58824 RepID=UPI0023689C0A|nr:basic juvenile hormone-suppressible protein 2-like [Plodia interpunctella]